MVRISADTYAKNCVNTRKANKKDNKSVLWIKMHHIQDKLGVKNMSDLTIKAIKCIYETKTPTKEQFKKHKKFGKEFRDDLTGIYIQGGLALSIIMDCRTSTAIEFRTKLGFNQHDLIMAKEQSVLTKIKKVSAIEKISLQHSVLSYKIDLYFLKHRSAAKVDEKGHKNRDKHKEVKRENPIK